MAQSIKLNDNLYWDTSSLHGGQIFNELGSIQGSGSLNITVPSDFKGIVFMFRNANTMSAYMINTLSGGGVRVVPILSASELSLTSSASNSLTATSTGTTAVSIYYIGTNVLS